MSKIRTFLNILRVKLICINKHISIEKKPRVSKSCFFIVDSLSYITIGDFFQTRNNCEIRSFGGGTITIGDSCFLNNNVNIVCHKSIIIGNDVQIGHNVLIIDHDHDYKHNFKQFVCQDIIIGNNVWIGANAVILKGSIIGNNAVIAAGSIVRGIVKDNTMFYNKSNNAFVCFRKEP